MEILTVFPNIFSGFMSYIGVLLVDHTHNNPILRTFCQHLVWILANTNSGVLPYSGSSGFLNANYENQRALEQVTEMNNFRMYDKFFLTTDLYFASFTNCAGTKTSLKPYSH